MLCGAFKKRKGKQIIKGAESVIDMFHIRFMKCSKGVHKALKPRRVNEKLKEREQSVNYVH